MFGATMIVTRVFLPEHLNEFGVFFSLFNLFQIAAMLRLEQAIVFAKDPDEASGLALAALAVQIPVLLALALPTYFYLAANPATDAHAFELVSVLVVAVAASSGARLIVQLIARSDHFLLLAVTNLLRPSLIATAQALAALIGPGSVRLPLALAAGQAVFLLGAVVLHWRSRAIPVSIRARSRVKAIVSRNRDFVFYNLPQNFVFVLSESLVPLSISFIHHDTNAVALFWLASRAVFAPATVIAESIRAQVYRTIARTEAGLPKLVFTTSAVLFAVVAAPLVVLAWIGPELFALVFGPQWAEANDYALILGGLVALNMAALPFVGALPVVRLQGTYFLVECVGLLVRAAVIFLIPWSTAWLSVAASTVAYAAVQAAFFIYVTIVLLKRKSLTS